MCCGSEPLQLLFVSYFYIRVNLCSSVSDGALDVFVSACVGGWFGSDIGICRLLVDVSLCSVSVVCVCGGGMDYFVGYL